MDIAQNIKTTYFTISLYKNTLIIIQENVIILQKREKNATIYNNKK